VWNFHLHVTSPWVNFSSLFFFRSSFYNVLATNGLVALFLAFIFHKSAGFMCHQWTSIHYNILNKLGTKLSRL
jgi:hypothetical protein